ncbi:AAA family ATPase [Vibrio splendidus]|uniref:AAA family ATPase n=1 Tax=Vibrio splendidus TaxID=29497 RepID=UPI000D3BF64E|nr:ATP-binding protein [Vibrio splendidus]PTO98034.1 AAA family ATPase [Vibrio splendidus]
MNGKLIVKLIDAAIKNESDEVRLVANLLSSELRKNYPELSSEIARVTSSRGLRGMKPSISSNEKNTFSNDFLREVDISTIKTAPILPEHIEHTLNRIVLEHDQQDLLSKHGLEPVKTILFTGPPGVGKTMSAYWLANQLNLPLLVLDLATVVSSFLGKTGSNLKQVIESAAEKPCILLLDEFDAIGKMRGDSSDIGELKRLVTVLLQSMDRWPSSSILLGATNHPELLDKAIWRRFEAKIAFDYADDDLLIKYLNSLTNDEQVSLFYPIFRGQSYGEIKNIIDSCKKASILHGGSIIDNLMSDVAYRADLAVLPMCDKKQIAVLLNQHNYSQRAISDLLSISRPTVKKALTE